MQKKSKFQAFVITLFLLFTLTVPLHAESAPIQVDVPVDVTFEGDQELQNGVKLTLSPLDGAPAPAVSSITVKDKGKIAFGQIPFSKAGTYEYRLQAENLDPVWMTMDGVSDFRLAITVHNDEKNPGALVAYIVGSDWNHPADTEPKVPIRIHLRPKKSVPPSQQPSKNNTDVGTAAKAPSARLWIELGIGSLLMLAAMLTSRPFRQSSRS